jgi:hypothetical protein
VAQPGGLAVAHLIVVAVVTELTLSGFRLLRGRFAELPRSLETTGVPQTITPVARCQPTVGVTPSVKRREQCRVSKPSNTATAPTKSYPNSISQSIV